MHTVYQINYHASFGGGEVYTRAVCAALEHLGARHVLIHHRSARFWSALELHGAQCVPIEDVAGIDAALPARDALVLTHNVPDAATAAAWAARHRLGGFLHMPLWDRDPPGLAAYRRLFGVSRHVIDSARERGHANLHDEPLYGIADLAPRGAPRGPIRRGPLYEARSRKPRDRLIAGADRLLGRWRRGAAFERGPGLTLGVVSRLTPIKQFPELFEALAPQLARHDALRLEVFGDGGYATVRAMRRALAPLGRRVRFWGQQGDVATVYRSLDYVLSGLPEKEALGLNLIEAQACGTPVIAVRAPPFTETVHEPESGFLYRDPREDGGAEFGALLERLLAGAPRPDPRSASAHLDRFSPERFAERLARAIEAIG